MNISDIIDKNQLDSIEIICSIGFKSESGKDYIKDAFYRIHKMFGLYFFYKTINGVNLTPTPLYKWEINNNFILLSEFRDRRIDSILED